MKKLCTVVGIRHREGRAKETELTNNQGLQPTEPKKKFKYNLISTQK